MEFEFLIENGEFFVEDAEVARLMEATGLTEDEVDFEVEGLSDEELETAFTEAFGDAEEFKKKRKCSSEDDDDSEEDYAGCGKKKKKCSDHTFTGYILSGSFHNM